MERYRDFIYVDDVVEVFSQAVNHTTFEGETLNVGTGVMTTVSTLLEKLCQCFGIEDYQSVIDVEGGTPGDQFGILSSIDRLRNVTECLPLMPLEVGLQNMVDWARKQRG